MKTQMQTDAWIFYTTIVLGSILLTSISGMLIIICVKHSVSELLVALGIVAGACLAKLIISLLYRGPIE